MEVVNYFLDYDVHCQICEKLKSAKEIYEIDGLNICRDCYNKKINEGNIQYDRKIRL